MFGRVEDKQRAALTEYQGRLNDLAEVKAEFELAHLRAQATSKASSVSGKKQDADIATAEQKVALSRAELLARSAKAALDVAEREHSARQSWVSMVKAEAYVSR